jgi:hypothetical protein
MTGRVTRPMRSGGSRCGISKRDIRKAFGPATLQTLVDLEDAIKAHTEQIKRMASQMNAMQGSLAENVVLSVAVKAHTEQIRVIDIHRRQLDNRAYALELGASRFSEMGFLDRLKWLLTGK